MNHSRSNVPIRFCPTCGEIVNHTLKKQCSEADHAHRRKERNMYCCDCGKKLR